MPAVSFLPDQPATKVHFSLRQSLKVMDQARHCAVLWFSEVMHRRLFEELGYSSINQYAICELGFSRSRTGDFVRLARQLDNLPKLRQAMRSGELGYTKAREILPVATPATEDRWLKAARGTRKELVQDVKRVKNAARIDPGQGVLVPGKRTIVAPHEIPVRFQVDLTPEQEARRAALVERLHKLGDIPKDKAELILEALAALVESMEKTPRGVTANSPPVQIHVHDHEGIMTVQTDSGERELGRPEAERVACDAAICQEGGRNTTTIPPRIRREVLARDGFRCRAPGCHRTRFLEVHHLVPRATGGTNQPENLVTLCAACHRLWHKRGWAPGLIEQPNPNL